IGTLGMFMESSIAVFEVWQGVYAILSGYLMPLELFPVWVQKLARALPARYSLGFPVETLTGALTRGQAVAELGVQWCFALGLLGLCALLWRAGVKRYQAYGG